MGLPQTTAVNGDVTIVSGASTTVVVENPLRQCLIMTNSGTVDVYVSLGTQANVHGIYLPPGAAYEINGTNPFFGYIAATCDGTDDGRISFSEW